MNSMAKLSPGCSLGLPEKISIKRLVAAVYFCTASLDELADRPLRKASPRSVPGNSRKATKDRRLGPGKAINCSTVATLLGVYNAISYTLNMKRCHTPCPLSWSSVSASRWVAGKAVTKSERAYCLYLGLA